MQISSTSMRNALAATCASAAVLSAAVAFASSADATPVSGCIDGGCAAAFVYTGATTTFTVPAGVTSLKFAVHGAQGGDDPNRFPGVTGGLGATVGGILTVAPNEQLTVLVGQAGAPHGGPTFGGGGSSAGANEYLGSGGGGSFLFDSTGAVLVAAGGGGGAAVNSSLFGNTPFGFGGSGAGAGSTGGSGVGFGYSGDVPPTGGGPDSPGAGGTAGFDGSGGNGSGPAAADTPGTGGDGSGDQYYRGGGGGGGYYGGGGGGYAMSGAGGSGYASWAVHDLTSTDGTHSGNGTISFDWSHQPTTTTLAVTPTHSVFGQTVTAQATIVSPGAGSVQFAVDGHSFGAPIPVTGWTDGTAMVARTIASPDAPVTAGDHHVTATFRPADDLSFAASTSIAAAALIDRAQTATRVVVTGSTITANVASVRAGIRSPTGAVRFFVAGKSVGRATVSHGVARLAYAVPAGRTRQVAVTYGGSDDFLASSNSTVELGPSITPHVSSRRAKTQYGWYRGPVTVRFSCVTHGSALTARCPAKTRLVRSGAARSVTRTIYAADGGVDTVTVSGINIDRRAPRVRLTGPVSGRTYFAVAPAARCAGSDALSGIASCTVSRKISRRTWGSSVQYTAVATDRAGNRRVAHTWIHVVNYTVSGASLISGTYTIRLGRTYALLADSDGQPIYIDAAPAPNRPAGRDVLFRPSGAHRWALKVHFSPAMANHRYWNIGIEVNGVLHQLRIRVVR